MNYTSPILLLALMLGACAPIAPPPPQPTLPPAATLPATAESSPQPGLPATAESTPQPQATSRGDQLVASDPASVNLTSGKPALVEFFRFT